MSLPDVELLLKEHEKTKELQIKTEDLQYHRMVLDIPSSDQKDNFTTGTLAVEHGFAVSPAVAVSRDHKTVIAVYYLGRAFTGHKGYVHGGAIATVLDECCGRAALCHFESVKDENVSSRSAAVTAHLAVSYLAPVKTESCIIVQAEVLEDGLSKRKAKVTAKLWSVNGNGIEDALSASVESLFIEPKI